MAVPGYMGRNAKVGALARFLNAIEAGLVAPGSVLVVENLDRLSRNEPLEGLESMKTIINAGVDVVTLIDRQRYTRENMRRDLGKLLQALVILCRGYEESYSKAHRSSENWAQKRKQARANGKPITRKAPAWLKVVGVRSVGTRRDFSEARFVVIEERAALIRQMFEWSVTGWGNRRIARELIETKAEKWDGIPWRPSKVAKIIYSRAVLGEYQPQRYVGGQYGKRIDEGLPIKDYYPRIITDEVWEQAQPKVANRRPGQFGRAILSGLVFDPKDRPMVIVASGRHHVRKKMFYVTPIECLAKGEAAFRWDENHLERCVLCVVQGINWERINSDKAQEPERRRIENELAVLGREEAVTTAKITKAAEAFLSGDLGTFGTALQLQVKKLEDRLTEIRNQRAVLRHKLDLLRKTANHVQMTVREVPTDIEIRKRLAIELRALLMKLQVWPDGRTPDRHWKKVLDEAMRRAQPKRAYVKTRAMELERVLGAVRFFFQNGKAITAYFTYVHFSHHRRADLLGFANPQGMTEEDWADYFDFSGMTGGGEDFVVETA